MMRRMMMLTVSTMLMIYPSSSSLSPPGPTNDAVVVVVVFRCKVVRTYITGWGGPKPTIFRPFESQWRALSIVTANRRQQVIPRRVEMISWPFAGLKTGSTTSAIKKWPDDFSMIRRLNSYWRGLSISGIIINTWQSTNINYQFDDSLITLALHSMTTTAASLRSAITILLYYIIIHNNTVSLRSTITYSRPSDRRY